MLAPKVLTNTDWSIVTFQSCCAADLPSAAPICGILVHSTGHTQYCDPRVNTRRGMLPVSASAHQPFRPTSAALMERLRGEDKVCQADALAADPVFHWPSERVFFRIPLVIPYDSPIFNYV